LDEEEIDSDQVMSRVLRAHYRTLSIIGDSTVISGGAEMFNLQMKSPQNAKTQINLLAFHSFIKTWICERLYPAAQRIYHINRKEDLVVQDLAFLVAKRGNQMQVFHCDHHVAHRLVFLMHVSEGELTRIVPEHLYGGKGTRICVKKPIICRRGDLKATSNIDDLWKRYKILVEKDDVYFKKTSIGGFGKPGKTLIMRADMIHAGPATKQEKRIMLFAVITTANDTFYNPDYQMTPMLLADIRFGLNTPQSWEMLRRYGSDAVSRYPSGLRKTLRHFLSRKKEPTDDEFQRLFGADFLRGGVEYKLEDHM
jgi:hypothetical protein